MHTGLERVLMCYVCYRPDVGYVQVNGALSHFHFYLRFCSIRLLYYTLLLSVPFAPNILSDLCSNMQGMSYLVATLLLYMDEFEAFKCMANLLGRR